MAGFDSENWKWILHICEMAWENCKNIKKCSFKISGKFWHLFAVFRLRPSIHFYFLILTLTNTYPLMALLLILETKEHHKDCRPSKRFLGPDQIYLQKGEAMVNPAEYAWKPLWKTTIKSVGDYLFSVIKWRKWKYWLGTFLAGSGSGSS